LLNQELKVYDAVFRNKIGLVCVTNEHEDHKGTNIAKNAFGKYVYFSEVLFCPLFFVQGRSVNDKDGRK
jgi:L-ascorbate metabolism protein UlaG (beta-lactamase superfamily)